MLFVHVLFFLLFGTSVGTLPGDLGPHFPVTSSHRLENLHISGHGPSSAVYVKSQGRELPFFMMPGINHGPDSSRPLRLPGIAIHAGVWYREPTKNAHYRYNIIEIRLHNQVGSDRVAVIVFHEMGKKPGQVIWHSQPYIYLTGDNRECLVGTWSRMPSASLLIHFRGDKMTVAMGKHGLLSYSVLGRLMTILPAIQETSNLITWVTVFPVICKGTWVREITESTPENYANDVIIRMEQGTTQIFLLGSLPGQILLNPQRIYPGRVVGIWYRMPGDDSIEPDHLLDHMVIYRNRGGVLVYEIHQTPLPVAPR